MRDVFKDLEDRLPLLADRLEDDTVWDELTPAERYAVGAWARAVVDDLPDELLASCDTMGDLATWVEQAAAHGRFHPGRRYPRRELAGDGIALRPLRADHVPILYESAFTGERSWKWRFRGRTVPYETFAAMLHEGVFAQYAVESTVGPPSLLGLVSAYDADTACGHCYVAFHNTGVHHPASGRMFGAIIGFMDHLFHVSPFRKLYLDIPEYNVGLLRGFEGLLMVEEGRLREHYFLGGRFHDRIVYAVYREAFAPMSEAWYV